MWRGEEDVPQSESSIPALEDLLPLPFFLSLAATRSPISGLVAPRACRGALPEDMTLASFLFLSSGLPIPVPAPIPSTTWTTQWAGSSGFYDSLSQGGWPGGEALTFPGCSPWMGFLLS